MAHGEPVLIGLTVPARDTRRGLVDGLVVASDAAPDARTLDLSAADSYIVANLVEIAHTPGGFVAHTDSGARALGLLAATVAALCGEDIGAALRNPDIAFLTGLKPEAVDALREVLLAVTAPDPAAVAGELHAALGRRPPDRSNR